MPSRSNSWLTPRAIILALAFCLVAGCSHMHWPWHKAPPPAPVPVHELDIAAGPAGVNFPQYWKRNTLLVDLSAASGTGSITLQPVAGTAWPVRVAFRVTPAAVAVLEVQGEEHVTVPISATGGPPVDLELPPGVYTAKTAQLSVRWGPPAVVTP